MPAFITAQLLGGGHLILRSPPSKIIGGNRPSRPPREYDGIRLLALRVNNLMIL